MRMGATPGRPPAGDRMARDKGLKRPPRMNAPSGAQRRIGVEIEFAALGAGAVANEVRALFGGTVEEEDRHRFHVRGTGLGDFVCELDSHHVHRAEGEAPPRGDDTLGAVIEGVRASVREIVGDIGSLVIPFEVVCPPVPLEDLPKLERLVTRLREAGAAGTRANPLYGFGTQLNPEIAEGGTPWILAVLKAYLLLSPWLRAVMRIDMTRRVVAFADPFPAAYVALVVDPDYAPGEDRLIDDYLRFNPTRNRELDLLPLFAFLDGPRVARTIADPRIKARPTFHYRLPDADFGDPRWGLLAEWDRWRVVEQLAEDGDLVAEMGAACRENLARTVPEDWALRASEWIVCR